MGVFKNYSIEEANLILTEPLYWTFEPNRQDSIKVWTLINFEKTSVITKQLDKLISYEEDVDIEIEEKSTKKELCISTYFDQGEYRIVCDKVKSEIRPYNEAELTEIILAFETRIFQDQKEIFKYSQFIKQLKQFAENERVKKERILEQVADYNSESIIKAKAKLDLLNQLMNIVMEFEQEH